MKSLEHSLVAIGATSALMVSISAQPAKYQPATTGPEYAEHQGMQKTPVSTNIPMGSTPILGSKS